MAGAALSQGQVQISRQASNADFVALAAFSQGQIQNLSQGQVQTSWQAQHFHRFRGGRSTFTRLGTNREMDG